VSVWTVTVFTERAAARRVGSSPLPPPVPLPSGSSMVVGREGDLQLGSDPLDTRVSRRALIIDAADTEWNLRVLNTNGAVIHPWGLRAYPVSPAPQQAGYVETLRWPKVGVRILGGSDLIHWVLLQSTDSAMQIHGLPAAPEPSEPPDPGAGTEVAPAPKGLSPKQLEALRTVFEPQLAWPPSLQPPRQLKQAATRMNIGYTAVQGHLDAARQRALALGLPESVSALQPECLYTLVAAGLVRP
jgi:hypothetical protein